MPGRRVSLKEGAILCYLLLAFVGGAMLILEELCQWLGCPKSELSIPVIGGIALVMPFQYKLLDLWKTRRSLMLLLTLVLYAGLAVLMWGLLTKRIPPWG